jgi:hypothetical protein
VQPEAPPTEYVPLQQLLLHQVGVVAPVLVEYFPAGHWTQVVARSDTEYVPGLQMVQTGAPCTEYLPALQLVHTS